MNKFLLNIIFRPILLSGLFLINSAAYAEFAGGDGTPGSPYQIETAEQLHQVRDHLDASYILNNDINLEDEDDWEPISGIFNGYFNGNGNAILHLTISKESDDYVGFFEQIGSEAVIRDLGLDHVYITGNRRVGSLTGRNDGEIVNCYSTGTVVGNMVVGGLIGRHNSGILHRCYSYAAVSGSQSIGGLAGGTGNEAKIQQSYAAGNVSGTSHMIGGLVGRLMGEVEDSYAKGNVEGPEQVGGFAGTSSDTIRRSYSTGIVTGNANTGGFVGELIDGGIINSFWNTESSGLRQGVGSGNVEGIFGRNTQDMTSGPKDATYNTWDFEEVWETDPELNHGYPFFRWNGAVITNTLLPQDVSLKIYPNPVYDFLNVKTDTQINFLTVFDISGRKIIEQEGTSNELNINVQNLKDGQYFIILNTRKAPVKARFIKTK